MTKETVYKKFIVFFGEDYYTYILYDYVDRANVSYRHTTLANCEIEEVLEMIASKYPWAKYFWLANSTLENPNTRFKTSKIYVNPLLSESERKSLRKRISEDPSSRKFKKFVTGKKWVDPI